MEMVTLLTIDAAFIDFDGNKAMIDVTYIDFGNSRLAINAARIDVPER